MATSDTYSPNADNAVLQELRRVGDLLERLVALEEERRDGERQMEALGAMLAGGDSQADVLSDNDLITLHFRQNDGSYWIAPADTQTARPATPEEAQRLQQLVGRKRGRS